MRPRIDPSPELLQLARAQSGVISTEQTAALGLPRRSVDRLLAEGRWRHLTRGIYLVDDQPPTWLGQAWTGVLLGGSTARLGGQAATHLWELQDEPRDIEVLVSKSSPVSPRPPWRFAREQPGVRSGRSPGQPPRTTIEDAVIDQSQRCTVGELIDLVTRAVQSRRTTPARLARCAAARSKLRHRKLLMQLLGEVDEEAQSPLELRFLRDVERPHRLPKGARQERPGYGRFYQDVRYDQYAVVVELDGRTGHDGASRFRDMNRDNLGVVAGSATLRYGWWDTLERPCPMAFQIGSVLIQRGWTGSPIRCPRCRNAPDEDLL